MTSPDDRYRVQSVERAVFVLGVLGDAGPDGLTLSELSRALGVSKSSAFAILQTLLGYGFVATASGSRSRGSATSSSRSSRCATSPCRCSASSPPPRG